MNDTSSLLGYYDKPVVPQAWDPQPDEIAAVSPWSEAFKALLARTVLNRRDALVKGLSEMQEGQHADIQIWRFVLLRSTWTTFAENGIGKSDVVRSVLARLSESDLDTSQSIALLDLLISAEQVGPVDPTKAVSLDRALDLLLDSIEYDGWTALGDRRAMCLRREGWGCEKATLQEIGSEIQVSRERVRQIVNELDWPNRSTLRTMPLAPEISMADLLKESDRRWKIKCVEAFLTAIGHAELVEAGKREVTRDRALGEKLRSQRNALGFIDCRATRTALNLEATNEQLERACSAVYSVCVREGDWIMASTAPQPYAVTCVLEQLAITSPLVAVEAVEGVQRQSRGRSLSVPPGTVLIPLLSATKRLQLTPDGNLQAAEGVTPPYPGGVSGWLVRLIDSEPDRVAHRDKIMTAALDAGHNVSTVIQYLTFHHCVRGCGQSCFTVVGNSPTEEEIDRAARVASIARVPSAIDFRVASGNVEIEFTCGNSLMNSSTAGTTRELRALLPAGQIPVSCCGLSLAGPRIYKDGNLINLRGVLSHLQNVHDLALGDRFILIVPPQGEATLKTV